MPSVAKIPRAKILKIDNMSESVDARANVILDAYLVFEHRVVTLLLAFGSPSESIAPTP